MRGAGRVDDQAANIADVDELTEQLGAIDERAARSHATLQIEGHDRPRAARQILLRCGMEGARRQTRVVDLLDLVPGLQPFGERLRIRDVAFQPQRQGLDALQDQEGVEWGDRAAGVSKQLDTQFRGEGTRAERLPVLQAVVAGVRLDEAGEAVPRAEVEGARVDDQTGDGGPVATEVLGRRVHHDVRAVLDGAQEIRRRHGVVHHQRHADLVREVRHRPDVEHVAARVGQGLGEEQLGVRLGGRPPGVQVVLVVDEADLDAELGQRVVQQVVGAAVEGGAGHQVVARTGEVEDGRGRRRRTRCEGHRGHAALQRRDPLFQDVLGGVHDPRVDVARFGQAEQIGAVLGVAEDERRRLVDRRGPGARGRVGCRARVHLFGLEGPACRVRGGRLGNGSGVGCLDGHR